MTVDPYAHIYDSNLEAGVYPQKRGLLPSHFQLVGENGRALVVTEMRCLIDLGGVHVTDPDHLDEMAERLHELAEVMRVRVKNGEGDPR